MTDRFDLAVVGAGPAGLAAAVTAAEQGLRVGLVDAAARPGGQYWRHPAESVSQRDGHGTRTFRDLRRRLRALRDRGVLTYLPDRQVWFVERDEDGHVLRFTGTTTAAGGVLRSRALVLCPGGYDRQLPVPGWDLPGVMAAGGVQALLKGNRTLAGRRAVIAGTGPFLLPVATALADAGVEVVAVCEANHVTGWARNPLGAMAVPTKAVEALGYAAALLRHRVPYRMRTAVTAIHGTEEVEAVTLSAVDAEGRVITDRGRVEVDLVALGWGFTPSLELVTAVGADTRKDVDGSLVACVDEWQRASAPGVYVAGEATGVGGAELAVAEGELAGLTAASDLGGRRPARRVRELPVRGLRVGGLRVGRLRAAIRRRRAFATAMHLAHPVPAAWPDWLTPETTVCRCEEVTAGEVCRARDDLGAVDVRTVKLLARPGMGWCQGRICGYATAVLAAAGSGDQPSADDLRSLAHRSICAPVSLAELADSHPDSPPPDHQP
ncbi:FAD/NAD(P)-dependent oxidoreductase [Saccharothrix deserti]|uniref:FAD/NAD(P)-dependent oxidoreductase n=1 Tax=Saccharothrix deserti TaxID=2593674 RepID=UPI00131E7FAC|nr:NAD(P)/FAD-dependent oxidoreductase [Saccharothrix deserti]